MKNLFFPVRISHATNLIISATIRVIRGYSCYDSHFDLHQNVVQHFGFFHPREPHVESLELDRKMFVVNSQ